MDLGSGFDMASCMFWKQNISYRHQFREGLYARSYIPARFSEFSILNLLQYLHFVHSHVRHGDRHETLLLDCVHTRPGSEESCSSHTLGVLRIKR